VKRTIAAVQRGGLPFDILTRVSPLLGSKSETLDRGRLPLPHKLRAERRRLGKENDS